jgi:Ca2+-binding RTX toxin-like protein
MLAPVKTMSLPEKMSEIGPKPLMSIGRAIQLLPECFFYADNCINGQKGLAGGVLVAGGNDQIQGGIGQDEIYGNGGNDLLIGDSGDDKLYGDNENDCIYGGDGNDLVSGGNGDDDLTGGFGADEFICGSGQNDIVHDFNKSEGDTVIDDCEMIHS